ncbi:MAG: hypothetical protein R3F59_25435 [Myxococcota bacterium]
MHVMTMPLLAIALGGCTSLTLQGPKDEGATDTEDHEPVTPGVKPGSNPTTPAQPAPKGPPEVVTADNCDDLEDGGPVAGPECVTATVECGQKVIGHTKGGTNVFDEQLYQSLQCTPAFYNYHEGGERAYLLELPAGDMHVDVWLDTPCVDLDLAAFRLPAGVTCPTADSPIEQCDMWPDPGTQRDHVRLVSQGGSRWLVVVEGKDGADGLFGLTFDCAQGL